MYKVIFTTGKEVFKGEGKTLPEALWDTNPNEGKMRCIFKLNGNVEITHGKKKANIKLTPHIQRRVFNKFKNDTTLDYWSVKFIEQL